MDTLVNSAPLILKGLVVTLQVSLSVLAIGTVIGLFGGFALLYAVRPVRWLVRIYVDTIRGIPLLVLIFAIFYGFPLLGVRLPAIVAAIIALSVFAGAHVSEVVRGAVASIPQGQTDAAKAIGLTFQQRLRFVILPQAISRIIPPWTNTAVEMVKASSLVSLVSVIDLMLTMQQIIGRTRQTLLLYAVAALLYFIINYTLSQIGLRLEKYFSY